MDFKNATIEDNDTTTTTRQQHRKETMTFAVTEQFKKDWHNFRIEDRYSTLTRQLLMVLVVGNHTDTIRLLDRRAEHCVNSDTLRTAKDLAMDIASIAIKCCPTKVPGGHTASAERIAYVMDDMTTQATETLWAIRQETHDDGLMASGDMDDNGYTNQL